MSYFKLSTLIWLEIYKVTMTIYLICGWHFGLRLPALFASSQLSRVNPILMILLSTYTHIFIHI